MILDSVNIRDANSEDDNIERPASALLMNRVIQMFESICQLDKPKNGLLLTSRKKHVCYNALQVFLRNTEYAKKAAEENNLFDKIMERFNVIHLGVGMNCMEYIRKYGDRKVC